MSTTSSANNTTRITSATFATAGGIVGGIFGGPWGAAAGAAVGGQVGASIGGLFGGKSAKKKARRAYEAAMAVQKQRETNAAEEQSLQQIRETRIARATSLAESAYAGIATSSLTSSALSSIGSQSTHNMQYYANDRRLYELYAMYMEEAGQYAGAYQSIMGTANLYSGIFSAVGSLSSVLKKKPGLDDNGDILGDVDTFNTTGGPAIASTPRTIQLGTSPMEAQSALYFSQF